MAAICYLFIYIFEALISWIYFSEKFTTKKPKTVLFLSFTISTLLQFGLSFIGIPFVNLLAFLICNLLLCYWLFNSSILQSIFNSILLSAIMLISELCIIYSSTVFFETRILEYTTNNATMWLQTISTKLLYFLVAYLITKLSTSESRKELRFSKASLLFLLPLVSIILLHIIVLITMIVDAPKNVYTAFIISALLLSYANFIVFWVHESMVKTQKENIGYKLQKQKAELDTEYYTILQNQYENSNIIIHDIKRHLLSVKELANQNDCKSINDYIDHLYDEYQIKYLKKYSNHQIVNAIINRYMMMCKDLDIDFYCDVRDIDFSFISDANLTSILDNLLENAFEAAKNSENKTIELTIRKTNVNFVVIQLENSCSQSPKLKKGELQTTKSNQDIHGYGIKSIKRITKDYDGMISHSYDPETMIFTFTVVLNASK